jgi:hypothetical protein
LLEIAPLFLDIPSMTRRHLPVWLLPVGIPWVDDADRDPDLILAFFAASSLRSILDTEWLIDINIDIDIGMNIDYIDIDYIDIDIDINID